MEEQDMKLNPINDNESENQIQDNNDDQIDILDGYLAYDMSQFHGIISDDLDFQIDDFSDSLQTDEEYENLELDSPIHLQNGQQDYSNSQEVNSNNHLINGINGINSNMNGLSEVDAMNGLNGMNGFNLINEQLISPENLMNHQESESTRQTVISENRRQHMPNYTQPIVEGDEIDPEIDLNMEPNGFEDEDINLDDDFLNEKEDDDDDDLNLFDSLDDKIEEDNKDPYTIVIRYPNEEYKVTIFCPKTSEYGLNDQESKIFLRNAELLQENQEMTAFYKYLNDLGIQQDINNVTVEDLIRQDQLQTLNQILKRLEEMRDIQQKWLDVCPTFTFSGRLQAYVLQLQRFSDMVKYVQDFNAGKASGRRFLHGRKGFYFIDQQNRNDKKQQIDQQEQQKMAELQQQMNQNDQTVESTSFCIIFFKAIELYNQYQHFLHNRKKSDKYQEVIDYYIINSQQILETIKKFKSRYQIYKLMKNKVTLVKRNNKQVSTPIIIDNDLCQQFNNKPAQYQEFFTASFQHKKIMGLSKVFQNMTNNTSVYMSDKLKQYHQKQHWKSMQNNFLEFSEIENQDCF